MRISSRTGLPLCALLLLACSETSVAGPDRFEDGINFTAGGTPHAASGTPGSDILSEPFAVALRDSLGGFLLVGYSKMNENEGNLLIVQGPLREGTLECADVVSDEPCHGRYFVGVKHGESVTVERSFTIVSGSLTVTSTSGDRFRGTFRFTLQASDNGPDDTIVVEDGQIDVPFLADTLKGAGVTCLIELASGAPDCGGRGPVDMSTLAIHIEPREWSARAGDTLRIAGNVRDARGNVFQDAVLSFSTEETSIVRVTADGHVTALAAGRADVHARYRDLVATTQVTIVP